MNIYSQGSKDSPTARHALRRSVATLGVVGIVGGLLVAAPVAASAETTTNYSYAEGQYLSGSLAGLDLARLVELQPATASNSGGTTADETIDPLAVSLLGTEPLALGAVRVSPDRVINTSTRGGVLSQYARAASGGVALGASGTVGQGGAIGPNASNPGSAFTLAFDSLLSASANAVVTDLKLQVQAIAAQANASGDSHSGDYYIDGLTLTFVSPALAGLTGTVTNALGTTNGTLNGLNGQNGELALAVNALLKSINPALNLAGNANVAASVSVDLQAAVSDLLVQTYGGQGVTFDVSTGRVTVDLEKLVGGDLNNRPVNTELLTSATVNSIVTTLSTNVTTLTKQILDRVELALSNARVNIDADMILLTEQAPVLKQVCNYEDANGKVLSEVLGKLLGKLVCRTTSTLLPALQTSVSVDVHGTVAQVIAGTSPATVTAKVLGAPISISTSRLLAPLGNILNTRLLSDGGVLGKISSLLDGPLLTKANQGLLGTTGAAGVLTNVLSLTVNVQGMWDASGTATNSVETMFTQTALRVTVLGGANAGSGLTTLNLASGSVGNAAIDRENPGDPIPDPGPTDPPNGPGGPGSTPDEPTIPSSSGPGSLAFTGVAIGGLIALLLALLAAGAWLIREGYGRKQTPVDL